MIKQQTFGPVQTHHIRKFLMKMNLRQYPPRRRTMWFKNRIGKKYNLDYSYKLVPIQFPWLSFGFLDFSATWPIVYGHMEPWKDLTDAVDKLRCLPSVFHTGYLGSFCPGDDVVLKDRSPEEWFFNTVNDWPNPPKVIGEQELKPCSWEYIESFIDLKELETWPG
jgi:hypothetical protein